MKRSLLLLSVLTAACGAQPPQSTKNDAAPDESLDSGGPPLDATSPITDPDAEAGALDDGEALATDGGLPDGLHSPDSGEDAPYYSNLGHPIPASNLYKRVFVTDGFYSGRLIGDAGTADAICSVAAQYLQGTWLPWLSTSAADQPSTRLTHSTVPYVDLTDITLAKDWNDLVATGLKIGYPINEFGDLVTYDPSVGLVAWTGTDNSGNAVPAESCDGFTSDGYSSQGLAEQAYGITGNIVNPAEWSSTGPPSQPNCFLNAHVYCFEQ